MNTPYPVKKDVVKKGKKTTETKYVRNMDKRKDFIAKFDEKRFKSAAEKDPERWGRLADVPIPDRYRWLWWTFLEIWRTCQRDFAGNVVLTPRVLMDYCECFRTSLTVREKRLVFQMKSWAEDEAYKLKEKTEEK